MGVLRRARYLPPELITPLLPGMRSCFCKLDLEPGRPSEVIHFLTSNSFGGTNGTQWFNDVWAYDPKTVSWTQLDCIGYIPAPREGHSAALVGDVMYIFGGRTEEGTDLGDLAAFRISSRRWYTFQNMGPSPSPRSGHSMTAYGKQIVVMAGEPSSAPRDPGELGLIYVLDTAKIRYPNDQQIQQTPAGERVPGNRRPSQERGMQPNRAIAAPNGAPESLNRKYSASRENIANQNRGPGSASSPGPVPSPGPGPGPGPNPNIAQGPSPGPGPVPGPVPGPGVMGNGPPPQGRGSQIPRASMAQTPSGPPPQQQAPPPRANGVGPQMNGSRSRTPTRDGRGFGPGIDTGRQNSVENENEGTPVVSPVMGRGERSASGTRAMSPAVNGRRTPQQQAQIQQQNRFQSPEEADPQRYDPNAARSRSRQATQEQPVEDSNPYKIAKANETGDSSPSLRGPSAPKAEPSVPLQQLQQMQSQHQDLQSQHEGLQNEHRGLQNQHENLQQELGTLKNRNVWYSSELILARKAGYQPPASQGQVLDDKTTQSFGEDDRSLIEAFMAMRAELNEVRGTIAERESAAAEQVTEVENQRDNAIREAAYARAKLAAHGVVPDAGTPQSEAMSRDLSNEGRSGDLSKKLVASLAVQQELQATIATMTGNLQNERRARELAEGSSEAAHRRVAEFEQSQNTGEIESLRTELHQVGKQAREEAVQRSEAHTRAQMLEVDYNELTRKHEDALESLKQHSVTLTSLREAVTASTDKSSLLERKLDEERRQRSLLDQKLLQLRTEHEERTAELDDTTRKLKDAEDMVNSHAAEAKTHRAAVVAGLDKLGSRGLYDKAPSTKDERVSILEQQIENAQGLVKKNQADADLAAEKLRRAEERIAGLEAYQEQSSRESLKIHKQYTNTFQELSALQTKHTSVQRDLESNQREASALAVKHNALKELLDERGASEGNRSKGIDGADLDGPGSVHFRDLESKYDAEVQAHQQTKASIESQVAETDKTYREKLELLENDYQSAVSYVKGTEKMLKRMKDELTKYKQKNDRLQTDLDAVKRSGSSEPDAWDQERQGFTQQIGSLQLQAQTLSQQLQAQTSQISGELAAAKAERDHYRTTHENTQAQARSELEQLKSENSMLESRALDAEQRVTVLLDQVSASVGNYRRQSQNMNHNNNNANGGHGHNRNLSSISGVSGISTTSTEPPMPGTHSRTISEDPATFPGLSDSNSENNRNSLALDTLASELETLRSHWEDSHRNYRLSNQFDFERAVNHSAGDSGVTNESLANWRKRLSGEGKVKGGLPRLSSDDEGEGVDGRKVDRESAIVKPHDRMPGGLSSDESSEDEEHGNKSYVI